MDLHTGNNTATTSFGGSGRGVGASLLPHDYLLGSKVIFYVFMIIAILAFLIFVLRFYISQQLRHLTSGLPPLARNGLNPSTVEGFPVIVYSANESELEATGECVVCLSEFREGERVRILPGCGHRFHVACIDRWFYSQSTCPICRCRCTLEPEKCLCTTFCLLCCTVDPVGSSAPVSGAAEVRINVPQVSQVSLEVVVEETGQAMAAAATPMIVVSGRYVSNM